MGRDEMKSNRLGSGVPRPLDGCAYHTITEAVHSMEASKGRNREQQRKVWANKEAVAHTRDN